MMNIRSPREPVIFSQMVDALLRLIDKERFDSAVRKRLRDIGVDLDHPLLVAYSVPTWFATVDVCAGLLHPTLPLEQARYRIGQELSYTFGRTTIIGGAVFQIFRMLGWKASLPKIPRGLQSGTNFLSSHTRFIEEDALEVTFEVLPDFHTALGQQSGIEPHFMKGSMDAMMALVGAPFHAGEYQPQLSSLHRVVYVLRRKSS